MKVFAGMKRKEEDFIRITWKPYKKGVKITEADFYAKGRHLTLTMDEIVTMDPSNGRLVGLMPILENGMMMMHQENVLKGDTAASNLAVPDGERTAGGIVLPKGVKLDG